jgi:hypothetical protein
LRTLKFKSNVLAILMHALGRVYELSLFKIISPFLSPFLLLVGREND